MDMDGEQPTRAFYWGLSDSQHKSAVVWSLKSLIPKNCILSPNFFICVKMHPWIDIWYRNWVPKKLGVPIFNMWGIFKLNLNSLLRNKLKEQLYSPRLGEHISAISTHCTALHLEGGESPGVVCGLITRWQEHSSGPPPWPVCSVCLQCVPIPPSVSPHWSNCSRCVPVMTRAPGLTAAVRCVSRRCSMSPPCLHSWQPVTTLQHNTAPSILITLQYIHGLLTLPHRHVILT